MKKPHKPRKPPALIDTAELCKDLSCIAAANLAKWPHAQLKIYDAVKRLQQLDAAAREAGILPRS